MDDTRILLRRIKAFIFLRVKKAKSLLRTLKYPSLGYETSCGLIVTIERQL